MNVIPLKKKKVFTLFKKIVFTISFISDLIMLAILSELNCPEVYMFCKRKKETSMSRVNWNCIRYPDAVYLDVLLAHT
jgi:hypothetical protein